MSLQTELSIKDGILTRFENENSQTIRQLRLSLIAMRRPVSADDARVLILEWGLSPGNWMGSLFKPKEWKPVGWIQSKAEGNHARWIRQWEYRP